VGQDRQKGIITCVNDYRVTRVNGKIPHWRVEHNGVSDIALTEQDAMFIIGEWLKSGLESGKGGDFRILWEATPKGFITPDIELVFSEEVSLSH